MNKKQKQAIAIFMALLMFLSMFAMFADLFIWFYKSVIWIVVFLTVYRGCSITNLHYTFKLYFIPIE